MLEPGTIKQINDKHFVLVVLGVYKQRTSNELNESLQFVSPCSFSFFSLYAVILLSYYFVHWVTAVASLNASSWQNDTFVKLFFFAENIKLIRWEYLVEDCGLIESPKCYLLTSFSGDNSTTPRLTANAEKFTTVVVHPCLSFSLSASFLPFK